MENDQEKALYQAVNSLDLHGNASEKINQLFALNDYIVNFFDSTMVMSDNAQLKANRLALLVSLVEKAKSVASFNKLNTK